MMKTVEPRRFKEAVSYLLDEYEPEELAALLLKSMIKDPTEIPVKITPERPLPSRKRGNSRGNTTVATVKTTADVTEKEASSAKKTVVAVA